MGSDGLCAVHGLLYSFKLNIIPHYDPSHGCHRDFDMALKGMGLKQMWVFAIDAFQPAPWALEIRRKVPCLEDSHEEAL